MITDCLAVVLISRILLARVSAYTPGFAWLAVSVCAYGARPEKGVVSARHSMEAWP
jgi:hypothetical protein